MMAIVCIDHTINGRGGGAHARRGLLAALCQSHDLSRLQPHQILHQTLKVTLPRLRNLLEKRQFLSRNRPQTRNNSLQFATC